MVIIQNSSSDPYFNLAAEEYLFTRSGSEAYFMLWQNDNTIVIGKNQNTYNEINMDFVKTHNVKISRRMTGGGAVYHDLGNVNFTFIRPQEQSSYDFSVFTAPVIRALAELGITAENQGRNDIAISGGKISGCAQLVSGGRVLHHGTLLFDSDLEFIGNCLTASSDKLKSHSVSSVRSRVSNISDFLSEKLSVAEFMNKILLHIQREFSPCEIRNFNEDELNGINELRRVKYAADSWIFNQSPKAELRREKRFNGCGTICVYADINGGKLQNCRCFGDFFGAGDVSDIEKLLNNVSFDRQSIIEALSGIDITHYFSRLTIDDFITLFE